MVSIEDTLISSYDKVQPNQTNSYGNAHGGEIVKEMDEKAAICASRFTENKCVTAKISEVQFHTPITKGDTVVVTAYVYNCGESSIEVHVRVEKEDSGGETEKSTTANLVMVAVDEGTNPIPFSEELEVSSQKDRELRREAQGS